MGTTRASRSRTSRPGPTPAPLTSPPARARLHVAPATCATKTCPELWRGTTSPDGYSLLATPAVANGTVLIASPSHELYAFRAAGCGAATCAPSWRGRLQGPVLESSVAVAAGIAYVGDWTGRLYAFAADGCGAKTCEPLWRADNNGPAAGAAAPVVSGGLVYSGSSTNFGGDQTLPHLMAFRAAGCGAAVCRPAWSYDVGDGGISSAPALAGGRLYVPTQHTPDANTVGVVQSFPARGCGQALCTASFTGVSFYSGEISSPVVVGDVVLVAQSPAGIAPGDEFHLFTAVFAYDVKGCGGAVCTPVSITSLGNDTGALNGALAVTGGRIYLQAVDQTVGDLKLYVMKPWCGGRTRTGRPGGSACRPR